MILEGDILTCTKGLIGFLRKGKLYKAESDQFDLPPGKPKIAITDDRGRQGFYPAGYFENSARPQAPKTQLTISNLKRLELINAQLAGLQAAGYIPTDESRSNQVRAAIANVDELLMQTGFSILE